MLLNIRDALGKDKADEVTISYSEGGLYRKAALKYLADYRESIVRDIISEDYLYDDRSDLRLVKVAELRVLEKLKKILE